MLKQIVSGRVFTDNDANGVYNSGDRLLVGATVMIIDDWNGNGRMDAGEPILGSAVSDGVGDFVVPDIVPGNRILAVQPAEIGGVWGDLCPSRLPANTLGGVGSR